VEPLGNTVQIRIDILLKEKDLLFAEKLELTRSMKRTLTLLGTALGGLAAVYSSLPELFYAAPIAVGLLMFNYLSNFHVRNDICEYIIQLESQIRALAGADLLQYETDLGRKMGVWKVIVARRGMPRFVSPFAMLAGSIALISVVAYGFSCYVVWGITMSLVVRVVLEVLYAVFLAGGILTLVSYARFRRCAAAQNSQ